jgi:16S rRNA processing protein RimM
MHLPPGHYYLDDLVGMTVLNVEGEAVGRITDVLRTGSNDVYVVNEGRDSILVPAIRDAIRELDLENGRILVEHWALEPPT